MNKLRSADLKLLMIAKSAEQKTNQWVYQLLRTNLICGKIAPGVPLTIRGLAETLDVSPMPVREALHRLACEGAVEAKNNRRVIVPMMTAEKFAELCEIRILIESHAAEKALPFGIGVVIGSGANYGLTRYVGKQAKKWYQIDRQMPGDE